jgi:hypothetical protein
VYGVRGLLRMDEEEREMTRRRDRIGFVTWRSGARHTVMVSLTIGFAAAIALTLPVCSQAAFAQAGAAYPGTLPE